MARPVMTSSFNPLGARYPAHPRPIATDRGQSPRSPMEGYSRQSNPIDDFFDMTHVNPDAQPLDVDDCLTYMVNFVKTEQLGFVVGNGLSDEDLRKQLRPQAEIAAQLPVKLRYDPALVMPLAVMGLYDLAVLIGGCIFYGHLYIPTLENKS